MKKYFSLQKRTYWRGIAACVLAHIFALAFLSIIFFFLKPFVWHAFSNAPYVSSKEPIHPESIEWLVVQAMNFISWFIAGIALSYWSPQNAKSGLLTIIGCFFALTFLSKTPNTDSTLILMLWFLTSPIGVITGNFYLKLRSKTTNHTMINLLIHNPGNTNLAETSFGGLPVKNNLIEFNWPVCSCCALPMQFLGKIASENYLYQIFMCQNDPGCCEEWDADEGGNRVIVTEMASLELVAAPPEGLTWRETEYSAHKVAVQCSEYNEARTQWANENNERYRDVLGQINGEPAWLQGEQTPSCNLCNTPMQFLVQLEEGPDSSTAMNFGGGCAYVFKCTCSRKSAKFLWQC